MRSNFNEYSLIKKALADVLLFGIMGFSAYYIYNAVADLLLPSQVQGPADPLDDFGKSINGPAEHYSVDDPSFQASQEKSQAEVSEVQKARTLDIIKANQSISDARKRQIMDELSGGGKTN